MATYDSTNFRLDIRHLKKSIRLTQVVKNPIIHTKQLPRTHTFLAQYIPSIFQNLCFNGKRLPFAEEAKNTEVGHLFEHLILEYLKLEVEKTGKSGTFDGNTAWDWSKYGKGTFNIQIRLARRYRKHFESALMQAASALEELYISNQAIGERSTPAYSLH